MKKVPKILFLILMILLIYPKSIFTQVSSNSEIDKIFASFENGIRTGAIKEFSNNIVSETYICLESGKSAYYSSSQTYYILKDFLQNYKPISFKLISTNNNGEKPFAIGKFVYSKNGIRGESQVFMALKRENDSWKISQIIITND